MAAIKGRDTKLELTVRKFLWSEGYRYRLHDPRLPGKPDIVFRVKHKVIFVHGCYWHRHENCKYAYHPKSNTEFWERKFARNVERDIEVREALNKLGWHFFIVWGCELKEPSSVFSRMIKFLNDSSPPAKSP